MRKLFATTFLFALVAAACSDSTDDAKGADDAGADVADDHEVDASDDPDASDDAGDEADAEADAGEDAEADGGDADVDGGDETDAGDDADAGDDPDGSNESDADASKSLGDPCVEASECASGHCVDGVCCETACDGICEACNVEDELGTCAPIPSGEDPDDDCDAQDVSTCGHNGYCDGNRACMFYRSGMICRASADACDATEFCPGGGDPCPDDERLPDCD